MFESNELIYIQMPKTACTHTAVLLSRILAGQTFSKHKPATPEQLASGKYFVSSIRNPWDWYLSLWTFGVAGKGSIKKRLTTRAIRRALDLTVKYPRSGGRELLRELFKNVQIWQGLYTDQDDVNAFRKWLQLVHDPRYSRALGEGYGDSPIARFCGFMTYRYLRLCCRNVYTLYDDSELASYEDVVRFEQDNCYIDYFIRQESLEDDLCRVLERITPLTPEQRTIIVGAKKTNTSNRRRSVVDYYDRESVRIVYERDRLLIEKYGYSPPAIGDHAGVN